MKNKDNILVKIYEKYTDSDGSYEENYRYIKLSEIKSIKIIIDCYVKETGENNLTKRAYINLVHSDRRGDENIEVPVELAHKIIKQYGEVIE